MRATLLDFFSQFLHWRDAGNNSMVECSHRHLPHPPLGWTSGSWDPGGIPPFLLFLFSFFRLGGRKIPLFIISRRTAREMYLRGPFFIGPALPRGPDLLRLLSSLLIIHKRVLPEHLLQVHPNSCGPMKSGNIVCMCVCVCGCVCVNVYECEYTGVRSFPFRER